MIVYRRKGRGRGSCSPIQEQSEEDIKISNERNEWVHTVYEAELVVIYLEAHLAVKERSIRKTIFAVENQLEAAIILKNMQAQARKPHCRSYNK